MSRLDSPDAGGATSDGASSSPLGQFYESIENAADQPLGQVDEAIAGLPPGFNPDAIRETTEFASGLVTGSRQDNVVTGPARTVYDTIQDYSGQYGSQGDTVDLVGPSFDPRDLTTGDNQSSVDWRDEQGAANDPTSPQNVSGSIPGGYDTVITAVIAGAALYLLAPLLEIAANLTAQEEQ